MKMRSGISSLKLSSWAQTVGDPRDSTRLGAVTPRRRSTAYRPSSIARGSPGADRPTGNFNQRGLRGESVHVVYDLAIPNTANFNAGARPTR